jgi:hypothetical protein
MPLIKDVKTRRLTGERYLILTQGQWLNFRYTKSFIARVLPDYSLKEQDVLFLTCEIDPELFTLNPKQTVIVQKVDQSHRRYDQGGYNEVYFTIP